MNAAGSVHLNSRAPIFFHAATLLLVVGGYSLDGSAALWWLTASCAALALISPRPLLRTARSLIWTGVLLGVIAFSANLERITPPETFDIMRTYQYDRIVTAALIPALTVLLMKPHRASATLVLAGTLPMLMLVVVRLEAEATHWLWLTLLIWGGLGSPFLAEQALRTLQNRLVAHSAVGASDALKRFALVLLVLVVAAGLSVPVSRATVTGLNWLGRQLMLSRFDRTVDSSGGTRLTLQAPPGGFEGWVRPLIVIQSDQVPGYLRTTVYTELRGEEWQREAATVQQDLLAATDESFAVTGGMRYRLTPPEPHWSPDASSINRRERRRWDIQMLPAYRETGVSLPIEAQGFEGSPAMFSGIDPHGVVERDDLTQNRLIAYGGTGPGVVDTTPLQLVRQNRPTMPLDRGSTNPADALQPLYPWLDVPDEANTLYVPAEREAEVARWVADCDGLTGAGTALDAMQAVVAFFHEHFEYALEGPPGSGDLLTRFMEQRQGHCTLFATAATLMLRSQGIPARVAGGYVSHEAHLVTGHWVVRVRDGHAWCEAWDEDAGRWRLVETTPPGFMPGNFATPGMGRLLLETVAHYWRAFRTWFTDINVLLVLAESGAWAFVRGIALARRYGWIAVLIVLPVLVMWKRRRLRARMKIQESERLRQQLIRAMNRIERKTVIGVLRRNAAEPWGEWIERISGKMSPREYQYLEATLEIYQSLRYQQCLDCEAARNALAQLNK